MGSVCGGECLMRVCDRECVMRVCGRECAMGGVCGGGGV